MNSSYSGADVRNLLEQLGARPIAFHASFARLAGSVTAGLMLSQAFFWSLHPAAKKNQGWFYKVATGDNSWNEETGLTRSEQETARRRLIVLGVMEERLRGMPARMHYRVNFAALAAALLGLSDGEQSEISAEQIANRYASLLARLSALAFARAVKLGCHAEKVNYVEVLLRENARCHICSKAILMGPGRSSDSLSFEHVIALSRGGAHVSENVKCAHAKCNAAKRDHDLHLEIMETGLLFDGEPDAAEAANMSAVPLQQGVHGYDNLNNKDQIWNKAENKDISGALIQGRAGRNAQTVMSLPLVDGTEYLILEEDLKLWSMTYPAVEVMQQLRAMRDWLISNPGNRKTSRGCRAFVTRWLSKQQDRAPKVVEKPAPPDGMRRKAQALPSECWNCHQSYDVDARAALVPEWESLFCSNECSATYRALEKDAKAQGVSVSALRRERQSQEARL